MLTSFLSHRAAKEKKQKNAAVLRMVFDFAHFK
jgi:hypothetical protein